MKLDNSKPLFRLAAILTLIVISVLISMQGFHYHETMEEEQACKWHNVIPMSFIMTTFLVVIFILNLSGQIALPQISIERVFTRLLPPDLLNLPPPSSI
ncbi:MAG: hypothetical protein H8E18_00160 [FCB group bacterium]|nr:hypothetical protein [FCB group bacterium]